MGKLIIPASKRAGWDALEPAFQADIQKVAAASKYDSTLVFGKRTLEEQGDLFKQGRDANGNVVDQSKIVTKAAPGLSAHNWGLAVDLLPTNPATGKGDWNFDAGFKDLADQAKKLGLTAGYYWKFKDGAHIESPKFTVAKAKEWLKAGGQAIAKAATSPAGRIAGVVLLLGLSGLLFFLVRRRRKNTKKNIR